MLASMTHLATAQSTTLMAEGDYNPYDQGVRHVATIAGYLCYGMMALTVCFGILTTTGWVRRRIRKTALTSLHMALAVSTLTFGVLHAAAYTFQTGEHFTAINAAIPFVAGGEFEVGLGIIGLELAIAVAASIIVQRRLGYQRWRLLHYLAYVAFALSLAHTIATSAEVQALEFVGVTVVGLAAACALLGVLRMLPARPVLGPRVNPEEA